MSKPATWVLGHHAIRALLATNPQRGLGLWVNLNPRNKPQTELVEQCKQLGIAVHAADKNTLNKQTGSHQHQGIALKAVANQEGNEAELLALIETKLNQATPPLLLILDQIQDPHNLGACLRSADAAGVCAVVLPKDKSSPITQVVQKVASGAAATLPIFRVSNLARCMRSLQQAGIWLLGTSDRAESDLYEHDLRVPLGIVMGAEGKGMRALTEKHCDALVSLPMAGSVVSSLNVSVATGVCLYEAVRQRTHSD